MNAALRKGWCPSLATPMATGDGLLVRLYPSRGLLSAAQLLHLTTAAGRHGNGLIEITARGNLQFRGLDADGVKRFADAVLDAGIVPEPAPEIRIPPRAALDGDLDRAIPAMADELRSCLIADGIGERIAPKFAFVVDSADFADLDALSADIRLSHVRAADGRDLWRVSIAGDARTARSLGAGDARTVLAAALALTRAAAGSGGSGRARDLSEEAIAAARADLAVAPHPACAEPTRQRSPVGLRDAADGSCVVGFGLAFGQVDAADLARFCRRLPDVARLCLSPDHAVLAGGLARPQVSAVTAAAGAFGMIARPDDPRLAIRACAGAPACASGRLATRVLAASIARHAADFTRMPEQLYLAGCEKQCARPQEPHVALTASARGNRIDADTPLAPRDRATLEAMADSLAPGKVHA